MCRTPIKEIKMATQESFNSFTHFMYRQNAILGGGFLFIITLGFLLDMLCPTHHLSIFVFFVFLNAFSFIGHRFVANNLKNRMIAFYLFDKVFRFVICVLFFVLLLHTSTKVHPFTVFSFFICYIFATVLEIEHFTRFEKQQKMH